jgi:DNA-binding SARP family transcriptional activator
MEFSVLGPVRAVANGTQLQLGGRKARTLLSILACNGNEVVGTDLLLDALWDGRPPASAAQNLRVYVYHLRRILGSERRIAWRAPGYELVVESGELDIEVFEALAGRGLQALDAAPDRAAVLLRRALSIWRGPALADLADVPALAPVAAGLEQRRLEIVEARVAADLMLGRHAALVGELSALVAELPLREHVRAQLMQALCRSGRRTEALEVYRQGRALLMQQLGVDPGPELQRLHQAALADADPPAGEVATRRLGPTGAGELTQLREALRTLSQRLDQLELEQVQRRPPAARGA